MLPWRLSVANKGPPDGVSQTAESRMEFGDVSVRRPGIPAGKSGRHRPYFGAIDSTVTNSGSVAQSASSSATPSDHPRPT